MLCGLYNKYNLCKEIILNCIYQNPYLFLIVFSLLRRFYSVHNWEDALMLAGCLALIYACLEAPHVVHNHKSFSRFLFHALHKFGLIFVMAMSLVYFDRY